MKKLAQFLAEFSGNEVVPPGAVRQAAKELGVTLPQDYVDFLKVCNGGEGMIGINYATFFRAEELAEMNAAYAVNEYAQGLLMFGTNGGGEAFAFDTRTTPWPVVQLPLIGMELKYATPRAPSFMSFLEAVFNEEDDE